jgi:hypothetical protein
MATITKALHATDFVEWTAQAVQMLREKEHEPPMSTDKHRLKTIGCGFVLSVFIGVYRWLIAFLLGDRPDVLPL